MIESVFLHEATHAGANYSGGEYIEGEEGNDFEEAAYGYQIGNYNRAVQHLNNINAKKDSNKKYQKKEIL